MKEKTRKELICYTASHKDLARAAALAGKKGWFSDEPILKNTIEAKYKGILINAYSDQDLSYPYRAENGLCYRYFYQKRKKDIQVNFNSEKLFTNLEDSSKHAESETGTEGWFSDKIIVSEYDADEYNTLLKVEPGTTYPYISDSGVRYANFYKADFTTKKVVEPEPEPEPEPEKLVRTFRPYRDHKEAIEYLRDITFIKRKSDGRYDTIESLADCGVCINGWMSAQTFNYQELLDYYTDIDDMPLGIEN